MTDAAALDVDAMLARLAVLDMAAAEHVHARLLATETPKEVAELGRTYQRAARSLRQTLGLLAKLRREAEADARRHEILNRSPPPSRLDDTPLFRQARLETAAAARLRTEYDPSEAEALEDELPDLLEDLWDDDFADLDEDIQLEAVMARLQQAPGGKQGDAAQPPDADGGSAAPSGRPQAGATHAPILFHGRLAPPMDVPSWEEDDDDSS